MVVAQLVVRSLPSPEIRGSNPVIGKILSTNLSTNSIIEKTKIKKKEAGNGHLFEHSIRTTNPILKVQGEIWHLISIGYFGKNYFFCSGIRTQVRSFGADTRPPHRDLVLISFTLRAIRRSRVRRWRRRIVDRRVSGPSRVSRIVGVAAVCRGVDGRAGSLVRVPAELRRRQRRFRNENLTGTGIVVGPAAERWRHHRWSGELSPPIFFNEKNILKFVMGGAVAELSQSKAFVRENKQKPKDARLNQFLLLPKQLISLFVSFVSLYTRKTIQTLCLFNAQITQQYDRASTLLWRFH